MERMDFREAEVFFEDIVKVSLLLLCHKRLNFKKLICHYPHLGNMCLQYREQSCHFHCDELHDSSNLHILEESV